MGLPVDKAKQYVLSSLSRLLLLTRVLRYLSLLRQRLMIIKQLDDARASGDVEVMRAAIELAGARSDLDVSENVALLKKIVETLEKYEAGQSTLLCTLTL